MLQLLKEISILVVLGANKRASVFDDVKLSKLD